MKWFETVRQKIAHFRSDENQRYIPAMVGLSVAIGMLILTSLLASMVRDNNNRDFTAQMYAQTSNIVRYKKDRISGYRQLLVSAATLDYVTGGLTDQKWSDFYDSMNALQRYSSIVGLGHVVKVPASDLASFQEKYQAETGTRLVVHPQSNLDTHYIITQLAPASAENIPVIGFDMATEKNRSAAMQEAAERGSPTLTKPLHVMQDNTKEAVLPGLIMYYPLYATQRIPTSPEERLATIKGFAYVVYRPHDILKNAVNTTVAKEVMQLTLQDVTDAKPVTLYSYKAPNYNVENTGSMSQVFDAENRTWRISMTMHNDSFSLRYGPGVIIATGTLISLLFGTLLYALLAHRLHRIEATHKALLQESKDALLAVASHQLRTPASAVKQYVGMLREGFVGDLSNEQDQMVEKAYAANERQLEIINQLLYVAKADAGQLFIDRRVSALYPILENSIVELSDKAHAKNILVNLKGKKTIKANVDPHFMSMIVENLVSNAIKYSYPDTIVKVGLRSTPSSVEISVKDQGVGVDEADFEALFEKFNRIENPLSRAEGGSGLGLFLTKRLIEAHGGDIKIESKKDHGTTFTVTLPHITTEAKDEFSLG